MEVEHVEYHTQPYEISQAQNTTGILSKEGGVIMIVVGFVFISNIFCLIGIPSNVINMIIFFKHGLNTTINISFFSLALSDLISLVSLLWINTCMNPLVVNSDVPFDSREVQYLTGSWPHACFGHITCWITAYMTLERYLCIAFPLSIKQLVTPGKVTIIMCLMYLINIASCIPECVSVYLEWKFFPEKNRSLIGLAFRENRHEMEGLGFYFLAVLVMVSFPAVVLFTVVLIVKMRNQTKWRMKSQRDQKQSEAAVKRDIKTVNMVILIAVILIVCYTPGVLGSLAMSLVPGFNVAGKEISLVYGLWGFIFSFEAFNSSVNTFIYYRMSTKFRNSFIDMMGKYGPLFFNDSRKQTVSDNSTIENNPV